MAHLEPFGYTGLVKMENGINSLAVDADVVAQACIAKASPSMEAIYKNTMAGAASGLGGAASSSATTAPKKNYLGDYAVSRPVGWNPNGNGIRYGMLAALFNYGVGPHLIKTRGYIHPGMPGVASAIGWLDRAVSAAEAPVKAIVEKQFDVEVKARVGD